jgi:hypothetical protein
MWGSCSFPALLRLLARNRFAVDGPRRWQLLRSLVQSGISTGAGFCQQLRYGSEVRRAQLREPPLFVLGHWRSGTTFLHDLLALDPRYTSPNTYECFMPQHFLLSEDYMLRRAPKEAGHRGSDNVPAGWDRPQEDEFALALLGQPSPYLTLAFPNHAPADPEYLDLDGVRGPQRSAWKRTLLRFLLQVTLKRPGRLVLKSPPHTARVKVLRELFPDAQFVYIVRNPYSVIPSTIRTFSLLYQAQGLQEPNYRGLEEFVFDNFRRMFRRLDEGRRQVPSDSFYELHYEDLARDPVAQVKRVYDHLRLGDFEQLRPRLEHYVASLGKYKPNEHALPPALRAAIAEHCGPVLAQYGYRGDAA